MFRRKDYGKSNFIHQGKMVTDPELKPWLQTHFVVREEGGNKSHRIFFRDDISLRSGVLTEETLRDTGTGNKE
jgi:hypothetical protein